MKKSILIIISILIIGIGVSAIVFVTKQIHPNNSDQPTISTKKHTDEDENQHTSKHETKDKKRNKIDNRASQDVTAQIKSVLKDTVKNTHDYFSGKQMHIVAIGDSLTQGVGDTNENGGYVGILDNTINQKQHLADFDNFGKRGNRTDQMLNRLNQPKIKDALKDADIITITIGANDIMQVLKENITDLSYSDFQDEQGHYKKRLRKIFDRMNDLNPDAKIYLVGLYNPYKEYFPNIPELGEIVKDWNKTGEKVAKKYENATFIPIIDVFKDTNKLLSSDDYFHPNTKGYKRIAKRVLDYMTS